MQEKKAIIIGAGPAGLTLAYELLTRTKIKPLIVEKDECYGGIARTVNYKGNRIDIGGHRFFSKSERVMRWWGKILPIKPKIDLVNTRPPQAMLVRKRKSRIYFMRKFFAYPVALNKDTLANLGMKKTVRIGFSYLKSIIFPIKEEKNLEDFFINRFGCELYKTFFESYTEKVWGRTCQEISAEWGAQRVKGLSIMKTVKHYIKSFLPKKSDLAQKETETSLIEKFLYPALGPGQLWEEVAVQIKARGGEILMGWEADKIYLEKKRVKAIGVKNQKRETKILAGDYFFSTMPIKDLARAFTATVPEKILKISDGLVYRDFITVGVLLKKLKIKEGKSLSQRLIKDNWIYIQEPEVKVGRMQIFNNWSPYLVSDPTKVWVGLEYFCDEGDALWQMSDAAMVKFAIKEMVKIDMMDREDVLDAVVLRMLKTYPAYFGTYDRFDQLKNYLDCFENLYLIGRNGMHRYNNTDHSMLTAMTAVDNLVSGRKGKANIWAVNTEQKYHESK